MIVATVLLIGARRFQKDYIERDYPLTVYADCDQEKHNCFIADEESADSDFQQEPYMKILISAADAPLCLEEHVCQNFECPPDADLCEITYCSTESLEEGEGCTGDVEASSTRNG